MQSSQSSVETAQAPAFSSEHMSGCFKRMHSLVQRHRGGDFGSEWDGIDIENWDFNKVSRSDAKILAKSFITTIAVAIFAYALIGMSIGAAIFMCLIKKSRVAAERHEVAQEAFRHHHHLHNQVNHDVSLIAPGGNNVVRQANGLGYERANVSEPNEDRPQLINRGYAIN
jgi:hypothetical protein